MKIQVTNDKIASSRLINAEVEEMYREIFLDELPKYPENTQGIPGV
jgi:hypothetical protein